MKKSTSALLSTVVQLLNVPSIYRKGNTQGLLGSAPLEVDIHKSDRNISQYLTVLQSVDVALLLEVTGHVPVSQLLISSSEPGHSVPPWDGGGSAQSRVLLCAPPPHVVLQELQLLHGDQLPSSCPSSALVLGLIQYNIDYFIPTIILVTLRRSEIGVFRSETCS